MAKYIKSLDPRLNTRVKAIGIEKSIERKLLGYDAYISKYICTCPEAVEGEHECSIDTYAEYMDKSIKRRQNVLESAQYLNWKFKKYYYDNY